MLTLVDLVNQPRFSDVSVVVGTDSFYAHKAVLAARCPYFSTRLESAPSSSTLQVTFKCRAQTMLQILFYIYSDELRFSGVDEGCSILAAAKELGLTDLAREVGVTLANAVDHDTVCTIWNTARSTGAVSLDEVCKTFAVSNFERVSRASAFVFLDAVLLAELLEADALKADSEERVYDSLMRWMHANNQLPSRCVEAVRFPLMRPEFLMDVVAANGHVPKELLEEAYQYKLAPARFSQLGNSHRRVRPRLHHVSANPKDAANVNVSSDSVAPTTPLNGRVRARDGSTPLFMPAERPLSFARSPMPDLIASMPRIMSHHSGQHSTPGSAYGTPGFAAPLHPASPKSQSRKLVPKDTERMPATFSAVAHLDVGVSAGTLLWESTLRSPKSKSRPQSAGRQRK